MSEIQIINSMHKSIINKITEFKNKEIKKNELNNFMLLNLCHILKTTKKIKIKNNKIKKKQEIEIKKSLSKIKSYNGNVNYNPKELKSNPIMNKLLNPTLDSYIPISEISYSTEIQFYKKNSDKCNFNESILFKKKEKKDMENEEKEIDFEEPPIIFLKNSLNLKKIRENNDNYEENLYNLVNFGKINNINIIKQNKENENDIIDLINKDDEELFKNEDNENKYKNLLFIELTSSFDEDNIDNNDDNIELDFKKIESLFYLDDIFSNQRLSKRNSSDIYNNFSSSISDSTSFGSRNTSGCEGKVLINKEIYQNEFVNYMSYEFFNKCFEQMSIDYLRYMLVIYSNAITTSKKCLYCENKMFLNIMKSFILKVGISSKKIYEKIIQNLINNNGNCDNICNFENFVKSFYSVLKLKEENSVLKYKFIISLFRFGEEDINVKHINIFLQLIRGKMMYDADIYDEFHNNLIKRYDRIYSNEIGMNFKYGNILLCLESFFDKKCSH